MGAGGGADRRSAGVRDATREGSGLTRPAGDEFTTIDGRVPIDSDFAQSTPLIVIVHGFTSDGKYLRPFGEALQRSGHNVFLFNYNSCRGIDKAAESLVWFLTSCDHSTNGRLRRIGVLLVGHSMGGVVARAAVLASGDTPFVNGIAMLGTLNDGALSNESIVDRFIDLGEYWSSSAMPWARVNCRSLKQLTKQQDGGQSYIDRLNNAWSAYQHRPPTLTISGGKNELEFGTSALLNKWRSLCIQWLIWNKKNDGLVTEESSCALNEVCRNSHYNEYPDYGQINHTYLKECQQVILKVMEWINDINNGQQERLD